MDALHWEMRIMPYQPSGMVIKIVIILPAFFVIVDSIVVYNHS
jgi:hypothetical protein